MVASCWAFHAYSYAASQLYGGGFISGRFRLGCWTAPVIGKSFDRLALILPPFGLNWWLTKYCISIKINIVRLRQNGSHFSNDIIKCIFLNENVWIMIKISLKFVPEGTINKIPALVPIMAWCQPGDKPLSEPMMVSTHTYMSLGFYELIPRLHPCVLFYQGSSPCLAKLPLNFTGGLAKILSTSLVKKATD